MSFTQVAEAMLSSDWQNVIEMLSTNTLTPAELEEKHGVYYRVFLYFVSQLTTK